MVDQIMDELPQGTIVEVAARAIVELGRAPVYTLGGDPLPPLPRGGVRVTIDGWRFDKDHGSHSIRMMYARDGRADDATCTRSPCTWAPRCPHCRACSLSWCRCACARFSP